MKIAPETLSADEIAEELRESDPALLRKLQELPKQLWPRHFETMEKVAAKHATDEAAQVKMEYLLGVLAARESAIVEYESKDSFFHNEKFISGEQAHGFQMHLQELLSSREHMLGRGQTARVKSMRIDGFEHPIAVKYLVTPSPKTLSVQGEHDMLYEVEVVTKIEQNETEMGVGSYIRVPHPYFYYKRGSVQCYGMSQINGVRLDQLESDDGAFNPIRDAVIAKLQERYASDAERAALEAEIKPFMKAVHKVCLHGDVAPKNIMVDTDGIFHLIDFGQSKSAREESEDTSEQFENLRALEPELVRECIVHALTYVRTHDLAAAA